MSPRPAVMDAVSVGLLQDCRLLALEMIRYERLAREACDKYAFSVVAEMNEQRELARERRSVLLREVWETWR